jgi:hypothetical protein
MRVKKSIIIGKASVNTGLACKFWFSGYDRCGLPLCVHLQRALNR